MGDLTYQSLMLIARTTSHGLTTIELGKELRQDQKMIFYYVKTLLEMKLVYVPFGSSLHLSSLVVSLTRRPFPLLHFFFLSFRSYPPSCLPRSLSRVKIAITAHGSHTSKLVHVRYISQSPEYLASVSNPSMTPVSPLATANQALPSTSTNDYASAAGGTLPRAVFNNVEIIQRRLLELLGRDPLGLGRMDTLERDLVRLSFLLPLRLLLLEQILTSALLHDRLKSGLCWQG
jgi:hypothetical protein